LEIQMHPNPSIPDPRQEPRGVPTPIAYAYLVAYAEGGRVNWAGVDRERAHELARNTGGLVCELPVVGDYTPSDEPSRPPMEYEEIGYLDDYDPDERSEQ
jgi:hypothetical protein